MSNWQGANIPRQEQATTKQTAGETVEAALYRLNQAYQASIACIIQVQKLNASPNNTNNNNKDSVPTVARAARRTLQEALLQDPWIAHFAPKSTPTKQQQQQAPANLPTSKGHVSTLQKLTYLSLVNLADLLIMGIPPNSCRNTILDRGLVSSLQCVVATNSKNSLWTRPVDNDHSTTEVEMVVTVKEQQPEEEAEPVPDTIRTAMLGYLDAVGLDASDPILWLKLASTAHRLTGYWRLEKYSLERAVSCLTPHEPPNRTALKALREFGDLQLPPVQPNFSNKPIPPDSIVLDLARYSWSNLGRQLLRTCRDTVRPAVVTLSLSPMLTLPPSVLATVCAFLHDQELWKLEIACRALSTLVLSARALNQTRQRGQPALTNEMEPAAIPPPPPRPATREISESSDSRVKRSSRRVQSQIESSEKRNERSNRRNSVEYCLLGATLGCTPDDPVYLKTVREGLNKKRVSDSPRQRSDTAILAFGEEASDARLKDSSLRSFVMHLSTISSLTPTASLFRFVSHASIHIGDVYTSDLSGSVVVSSCLLDCKYFLVDETDQSLTLLLPFLGLKLLGRETLSETLLPCWSLTPRLVPREARLKPCEIFALDLLHAELRLKQCESAETLDCGFDGDINFVSTVVPKLLGISDKLANELEADDVLDALRIRCSWLSANFFLWRRGLTTNLAESREAEAEGLKLIEDTRRCLNTSTVSLLLTPHLISPQRKGQHWRYISDKTLQTCADEIQAASIVLQAQEQFFRATDKFAGLEEATNLGEEDFRVLFAIGQSLLERYCGPVDAVDAKYAELIDDILESFNPSEPDETIQHWLDGCFPDERVRTAGPLKRLSLAPSILMILVTCLSVEPDQSISIALLFARLGLSVIALSESTARRHEGGKPGFRDNSSDPGDDLEYGIPENSMNAGEARLQQYAGLLEWLLITIRAIIETDMEHDTVVAFVTNTAEFSSLLCRSLEYVGGYGQTELDESLATSDLDLYRATQSLFKTVEASLSGQTEASQEIVSMYWWGSAEVLLSQRIVLSKMPKPKGTIGRADWYRKQRSRADLIAAVCCDVGLLLSRHLVSVSSTAVKPPSMFHDSEHVSMPLLCSTLLWYWKISSNASGADESDKNATSGAVSFDKFGRERLRVPVAAAMIAVCGSACSTTRALDGPVPLLNDFYDSDASSSKCTKSSDENDGNVLKVLSWAIHCACNVFGRVGEGDAVNYGYLPEYIQNPAGPPLPLVVVRVLNMFASCLLVNFSENPEAENGAPIWSEYPFGTRTVGTLLDSMLYKAYKCLHGFTLTNAIESNDTAGTQLKAFSEKSYPPESTTAVADLYRCIMRAYGHGRRTPPKVALDFVSAALPTVKEDEQGTAIRSFLFSSHVGERDFGRIIGLVTKRGEWDSNIQELFGIDSVALNESFTDEDHDEVTAVRRGLSNLIAQGSLPRYQESGDSKEIRSSCSKTEKELSKKFFAIVENMCFGRLLDSEGWFKASQCLTMRADLIADRLGLSRGFTRSRNFGAPRGRSPPLSTISLADLELKQEKEARLSEESIVHTLGDDLSVYLRHCWSSFESLRACAEEVGLQYREDKESDDSLEDRYHTAVWWQLRSLFTKKDFSSWQAGWGGLFVSSLRIMAHRCLTLALYSSYKGAPEEDNLLVRAEIMESLGVSLYTELMGSQSYGFPMREMTAYRKRKYAEAALTCFERSIETSKQLGNEGGAEGRVVWDISFVAGKCHEKIARTINDEAFRKTPSEDGTVAIQTRGYESRMSLAFQRYSSSIEEANELENGGGFIAQENGGSGHGSFEVLYRLHASRLKCLIAAVDRHEDERQYAIEEALRLTECNWHTAPKTDEDPVSGFQDRLWRVLADIVDALARCRLDNTYFHRSIYRHAQALMWAPVLYDPIGGRAEGSLGLVSDVYASKIRGLNSGTGAASSAVSIISSLFSKKRNQLVAVWVTGDGTTTAFQTINNSTRKYDSLRGKYIAAYVECLQYCRLRKELDTFLRWIASCKRDLPSYFAVSAGPNKEVRPHSQDSLVIRKRSLESFHFLTSIKRRTNSALADVIVQDLKNSPVGNENTKKHQKFLEDQLKIAYACFLRLKWETPEQDSGRNFITYQQKHGTKEVIEALTSAFLRASKDKPSLKCRSDWSGESQISTLIHAAVQKCKELFPNLSSTYSFSKGRAPSKKNTDKEKRKESTGTVQQFEVAVPEGLGAGETFVTSINVGKVLKKIRLTVPSAGLSTIRFSLDVPTDTDESPTKKPKPLPEKSPAEEELAKHKAAPNDDESPAPKKLKTAKASEVEVNKGDTKEQVTPQNDTVPLPNVTQDLSSLGVQVVAPRQGEQLTEATPESNNPDQGSVEGQSEATASAPVATDTNLLASIGSSAEKGAENRPSHTKENDSTTGIGLAEEDIQESIVLQDQHPPSSSAEQATTDVVGDEAIDSPADNN